MPLKLPIFTFHALDADPSPISYPPARFAEFLARLHRAGWHTLSLTAAAACLRRGDAFPARACVLTFDDGYRSVYNAAFPLLRRYGMTATVFVTTGFVTTGPPAPIQSDARLPSLNSRDMLSWGEIREMRDHGIDFGAHTLTHPDLIRLADERIAQELQQSRDLLADFLGEPITTFAYPFGRYNAASRNIAAALFECACSDRLGYIDRKSDLYALERIDAYYLRAPWSLPLLSSALLPGYVRARAVPRNLRRTIRARV